MIDQRNERNFTQLEVGGWYEAQSGTIEHIVSADGHEVYPFDTKSGYSYCQNGDKYSDGRASISNLIKRVKVVDYDAPDATSTTPLTLGDRPASELTIRQLIAKDMMQVFLRVEYSQGTPFSKLASDALNATNALIKAMEDTP